MFDDLATLRSRRSSKWVEHPADVLPAFLAEMDVEAVERMASAVA
jgi:bifunctional pyridoxal-dependent enzyme with beta-cystathionase and maltose regulon repressor activities